MKFVNQSGKSAEVILYDDIYEGLGTEIAREIRMLEVDILRVRINTPGGSVFDAYSIISAMNEANAHVISYIDGIAASSGALIALAADTIFMAPFGRLMIHNPSGGDDKSLDEVRKSIIEYTAKRTGMGTEEVEAKMAEETWMNFETAKALGIVDGEIDFEKAPKIDEGTPTNKLREIVNTIKNPDMKDLKNKLGLDSSATEEDIKNHVDKLMNEKKDLEQERDTLKEKVEAAKKEEAKTVVDNAIKEGKLDPTKKDALLEQAEGNLDSFKAFLDATPKKERRISDDIKKTGGGETKFDDKSFVEITKEKDGEKFLKNMKNEDPETFKAMYNQPHEPLKNLR